MSAHAERHHDRCQNCDALLAGPWCAQCGQKDPNPNPTLGELLYDGVHELTHWDGKVLATFRTLVTRPGQLTADFMAGRRARWLPPLRLYLIASIAYFLSGPVVERITHREQKLLTRLSLPDSLFSGAPGADSSKGTAASVKRVLRPEVAAQFDNSALGRLLSAERIERLVNDPRSFDHVLRSTFPRVMFVLLPLFALTLYVAFRGVVPGYAGYVPHLYFALHYHAFVFVMLTAAEVVKLAQLRTLDIIAGLSATVVISLYVFAAMRRTYALAWGQTMVRGSLAGLVYAGLFLACIIGAALVTLLLF